MFTISLLLAFSFIGQASDAQTTGFDDLGMLLIGGLLSAIGVAIVIVLLRLKSQNKGDTTNDFISISPARHKDRS
ncbi:MAG: hypothetical protein H0W99_14650 [Acidobacteria bacterium]|nr:hypothetical protein [Acidobacteriota bacterium]